MKAFEYTAPQKKQQAVGLLGQERNDAEVLAGGSDLLGLMKDEVVSPKRLVNVKGLEELRGIGFTPQRGLRIGSLMTLAEISEDPQVRRHYPMLAHAAGDAASPQIRHVATIGGNMCQRPRCWWFRNGFGLLALGPDGKSLVLAGDNRHHAILGNDGPAYFVSPSSVAPALIAYSASIRLFGPNGQREVPLEKFFVIPKSEGEREHDLRSNEIVTEIVVPVAPAAARAAHYEVRQKEAFD